MRPSFLLIPVLFLLGGAAPEGDLAKMQGEWSVASFEHEGAALPAEAIKEMSVVIKDDTMVLRDGKREEKMTVKLDPTATPKTMDMLHDEKSEVTLCIYDLDGDTLKLCWRKGDRDKDGKGARPTEFATKEKSDLSMMTLKRVKK